MSPRFALLILACSPYAAAGSNAARHTLRHPDNPSKQVEYFLKEPAGKAPWPTVIFLHGYQEAPRPGARDFVNWGVLDRFADRGYLAVAVSQPGYGGSSGPADFCGPFTCRAVAAVVANLRRGGYIASHRIVVEGISRGALVAGLLAARDPAIAGVVLISGVYDLPAFLSDPKSAEAKRIARAAAEENAGSEDALRARSVLYCARNIKAAALILNGAKDDRTDPEQARRLAAEINDNGGHARAIVYAEYGHHIPEQLRNQAIDAFIDGVLH